MNMLYSTFGFRETQYMITTKHNNSFLVDITFSYGLIGQLHFFRIGFCKHFEKKKISIFFKNESLMKMNSYLFDKVLLCRIKC